MTPEGPGTDVVFDPQTGVIDLMDDRFEDLVDTVRKPPPYDLLEVADFMAAGAVGGHGPHPTLLPGLRAVAADVCRVRTWRVGQPGTFVQQGWLLGEHAGLLDGEPGGRQRFQAVPAEALPARIARVVELGPRSGEPIPRQIGDTTRRVIDGVLSAHLPLHRLALERVGDQMPEQLAAWRAAFRDPRTCAWHAELVWVRPDGHRRGAGVIAIDTPQGLLVATPLAGKRIALSPTTSTDVWRRLLRMLPSPDSMARQRVTSPN